MPSNSYTPSNFAQGGDGMALPLGTPDHGGPPGTPETKLAWHHELTSSVSFSS